MAAAAAWATLPWRTRSTSALRHPFSARATENNELRRVVGARWHSDRKEVNAGWALETVLAGSHTEREFYHVLSVRDNTGDSGSSDDDDLADGESDTDSDGETDTDTDTDTTTDTDVNEDMSNNSDVEESSCSANSSSASPWTLFGLLALIGLRRRALLD